MQHRRNRIRGRYTSAKLLVAGLVLYGCGSSGGGGGGGGSTDPGGSTLSDTGMFIDSPVQGLNYTGAGHTGITEAGGEYDYATDESRQSQTFPVTFSVGGIELGTGIPGRYTSPLDFEGAEGAVSISDSNTVLNIARFLQTLDTDADPAVDGITIVEAQRLSAAGLSLNFDQPPAQFKNDLDVVAALEALVGPGTQLAPKNPTIAHFNASMDAILAGGYSGTFEGDSAGAWEMTISNDGELQFYFTLSDGTALALTEGIFNGDGSFVAVGIDPDGNGAQFNGTISEGVVEGTWAGLAELGNTNGTFSGVLRSYGLAFPDVSAFSAIEDQPIEGSYEATDGSSGTLVFWLQRDDHGRIAVRLMVDGVALSALYPTGVTSTSLSFRGINAFGRIFTGVLSNTGDVSGTFFSINRPGPSGSYSGSL